MSGSDSRLFPSQVCFVVDDVASSAADCSRRFGWGPFETFTATVEEAEYKGSTARRVTDVALGMAGSVQVELIHMHEGIDCVGTFQKKYGPGFQHIGVYCRSRDAAIGRLEACGATVDSLIEHTGIRIGFMDIPTGPGMFELLQPTSKDSGPSGEALPFDGDVPLRKIDRATIVTDDLEAALAFYSRAFDWTDVHASSQALQFGETTVTLRRAVGHAGLLDLELIEGRTQSDDPYSRHLRRRDHGLVHAGFVGERSEARREPSGERTGEYLWLETGESFTLESWGGGLGSLQVREPSEATPSRV
jgi:catechol 2,3-dioxygenase-like lactoylglutathione lyase family enzyme